MTIVKLPVMDLLPVLAVQKSVMTIKTVKMNIMPVIKVITLHFQNLALDG